MPRITPLGFSAQDSRSTPQLAPKFDMLVRLCSLTSTVAVEVPLMVAGNSRVASSGPAGKSACPARTHD